MFPCAMMLAFRRWVGATALFLPSLLQGNLWLPPNPWRTDTSELETCQQLQNGNRLTACMPPQIAVQQETAWPLNAHAK